MSSSRELFVCKLIYDEDDDDDENLIELLFICVWVLVF